MARRSSWDNLIFTALGSAFASTLGGVAVGIFGFDLTGMAAFVIASILGAGALYVVNARSRSRLSEELIERIGNVVESDEHPDTAGSVEFLDLQDRIFRMHARSREEIASRQVAIARSEEILEVLGMLEGPVIVFDRMGTIRLTNAASDRLFKCAQAPTGTGIVQMLDSGLLREELLDGLSQGALHGRMFECEYDTMRDDEDSIRQFKASILSLGDPEEGPFVLSLLDLTRENRVSRMKSDFVSKASHELRTPMASIRAYLEMLVDDEITDETERRTVLRSMLQDTDRLSALVDNMLNISKIEAGMVRPVLERTDLGHVSERVVHRLGPAASEKNISLSASPAPVDLTVEGDAAMLEQVVENLASNAIKYTPEGGRVSITIDTDPLEKTVVVSITDTGLGIPPDVQERVFEKFFRVTSYERMAKGTGLGLNLCRNIVESVHQGRIGVDSRVGEGSRFWFSVPVGFAGARAA